MKVRIKETGTLVDVFSDAEKSKECNCPMWACQIGRDWNFYSEKEIEFVNYIDWEQRRYEIAKDVLAAFMSNSNSNVFGGSEKSQAEYAVGYADALIDELKKHREL